MVFGISPCFKEALVATARTSLRRRPRRFCQEPLFRPKAPFVVDHRQWYSSSGAKAAPTFRWLDLEASGLSMLERLSLEEYLLKHTSDNWILVGRHHVWPPQHIRVPNHNETPAGSSSNSTPPLKMLPEYITTKTTNHHFDGLPNPKGMIVMGIGGKAEKLLNSEKVRNDGLLVVKRFSGGGTVVMDENAIWTTLIAGRRNTPSEDTDVELCKPYPRDIMKWTADAVFGPTFDKLNARTTASRTGDGETNIMNLPTFSLQEDDYVLTLSDDGDARKMGGNAQAITGKQGWLHHTSFLWDYDDDNMELYLKLPEKRPEYRQSRTHKDFLVKLKDYYGGSSSPPKVFVDAMKEACSESLGGIRETDWPTVTRELFENNNNTNDGGSRFQAWWIENRTRIQHEL